MAQSVNKVRIFLEVGNKKVFAGALDWPGWCRHGRDEDAALQALVDYGQRYAHVMQLTHVAFQAPETPSSFDIVERVEGNATTDFGATDAGLASDEEPLDEGELQRMEDVLRACWMAFDEALEQAEGKELRKGPRGGGRELDGILNHVVEAEFGYLSRLGWKTTRKSDEDDGKRLKRVREEILQGLKAAAAGELPQEGPRGGKRWSPRRFLRRSGWHVLDHVWEIEDRLLED